jgi:hypothetical protein
VARAKSTERAEARRRYRAYLQEQAEAEAVQDEEDSAPVPQTAAKAGRTAPAPVVRPGQRVGMFSAFKLATRPVHYIDDLRYAPTLILKTNAIWPSALISLAALAFGLTRTDYKDATVAFLLTFALSMIPLVQPMLAGFLAPRATWLAGLISGLISGICFEILFMWYFVGNHLTNIPADQTVPPSDQYVQFTIQVLLAGMTFGAMLGAGSGWYKRFLALSWAAPNKTQRPAPKKPAPKRSTGRR